MKGYLASLENRETEIKSVGYYISSTRMGKMKKSDHMNVGKDMAKQELSNTSEKSINWCSDLREKLSSKSENANAYILANPLLGIAPGYVCKDIHCNIICNNTKHTLK